MINKGNFFNNPALQQHYLGKTAEQEDEYEQYGASDHTDEDSEYMKAIALSLEAVDKDLKLKKEQEMKASEEMELAKAISQSLGMDLNREN